VLRDLEVGRAYPIVARLDGYEPKQAVVQPHEGDNAVTLELLAHAATVELDSTPTGATVEINHRPAGTTPLVVKTLPPGSLASITFTKPGYHEATAPLTVPGPGKEIRLVQPLAVAEELARVKIVSDPPGAQVIQNSQLVPGTVTPCEILVEAGKTTRFVLTMPRKIPLSLPPVTPLHGSDDNLLTGKLIDGVNLHLHANIDVRFRVSGASHCADVGTPYDCVVTPGPHTVDVVSPQAARISRQITAKQKDLDLKFELGYVEAGSGKQVQLAGGATSKRVVLEVGSRRVTVTGGDDGPRQVNVVVRPGATSYVN
jgi:hypothetical protein